MNSGCCLHVLGSPFWERLPRFTNIYGKALRQKQTCSNGLLKPTLFDLLVVSSWFPNLGPLPNGSSLLGGKRGFRTEEKGLLISLRRESVPCQKVQKEEISRFFSWWSGLHFSGITLMRYDEYCHLNECYQNENNRITCIDITVQLPCEQSLKSQLAQKLKKLLVSDAQVF